MLAFTTVSDSLHKTSMEHPTTGWSTQAELAITTNSKTRICSFFSA